MHFSLRALLLLALLALACGCVRRVVDITSDPDEAVVWVNDREVGTTPVEVEILHYGKYDIQVLKPGYEPIATGSSANPPIWDWVGLDLIAEILPVDLVSRNKWHYTLVAEEHDEKAVLGRAEALRDRLTKEESGSK